MAKVLGIATIVVNGEIYNTQAGASINVGGMQRSDAEGDQGIDYTEKRMAASLTCTLKVGKGDSIAKFRDIVDATVTFKADTGQSWILSNAWRDGEPPKATSGDGGAVELTFKSNTCEETLS